MYKIIPIICVFLCSIISLTDAQYVERWRSPTTGLSYIGYENTDADASKEVVLVEHLSNNQRGICVIDGVTGTIEWMLSPYWYDIHAGNTLQDQFYPRLIDANNDGKYEILFFGQPTVSDSLRWYLYSYSGGGINEGEPQGNLYQEIFLGQGHPNPTTSVITINYSLPQKGRVVMKIYNSTGQLIRTLLEGEKEQGKYTINWDSRTDKGVKVSSGSYFYQLEINEQKKAKRMVLVK